MKIKRGLIQFCFVVLLVSCVFFSFSSGHASLYPKEQYKDYEEGTVIVSFSPDTTFDEIDKIVRTEGGSYRVIMDGKVHISDELPSGKRLSHGTSFAAPQVSATVAMMLYLDKKITDPDYDVGYIYADDKFGSCLKKWTLKSQNGIVNWRKKRCHKENQNMIRSLKIMQRDIV